MKEDEDKKERRNNLVIYGIKESTNSIPRARTEEDQSFCRRLFQEVVQVDDISMGQVVRLGRQQSEGNRPRPLLVKLVDGGEKWNILKNARKLKNTEVEEFKKVIITPDMTEKERKQDKELRDELWEKRRAGEEGWYIYKGQLKRRNFLQKQEEN